MAVVGMGHFAQAAVLPAIEQLDDVELAALVSGSDHKLEELADRYGVRTLCHYDELDKLLATGRIDAVYIAVPNDLHAEMTLIAARHGVHVMCEKPMAPTEAECMQMIRACESRRIRLMIAYRLHFEAANLVAVEVARGGEIGDPRIFSSVFSMQVRDGNIRTQPRRGAGPIYDIGVYCINAARYLFRAEPTEAFAWTASRPRPRFREVEETAVASLRFSGGRLATFWTSFTGPELATFSLVGSKGHVRLDQAFGYHEPRTLTLTVGNRTTRRTYPAHDQFAAELVHFANSVRRGTRPSPSGEEGLADVAIIRALYRSAEIGRPVGLESHAPPSRPRPEQSTKRPAPARKPGLVQVVPPHPS